MQLPTSFSTTGYSPQSTQRTQSPPSRPERPSDTEQNRPAPSEASSQQSSSDARDRQAEERFERVEQTPESESSNQDLRAREQEASGSENPAINQYQQIARQEASNVQTQDPSLFRVDVYV